jgi:hypothetical protein
MLDSPCLSVANIVLLAADADVDETVTMPMPMQQCQCSNANAEGATVESTVKDGNER